LVLLVPAGRARAHDGVVPVCIITHTSREGAVRRAIAAVEQNSFLKGPPRLIRIEDV
jgi:hypothetical protein